MNINHLFVISIHLDNQYKINLTIICSFVLFLQMKIYNPFCLDLNLFPYLDAIAWMLARCNNVSKELINVYSIYIHNISKAQVNYLDVYVYPLNLYHESRFMIFLPFFSHSSKWLFFSLQKGNAIHLDKCLIGHSIGYDKTFSWRW